VKRRLIWLSGLLLVVAVPAIIFTPFRYVVKGWVEGESFYGGWPASYWIDALSDEDPQIRHQATSALGFIGPDAGKAVPALIKALEDPNTQVRWGAAHALGEIRQSPEIVVPSLLQMLSSKLSSDREWAITGLGLFGPDARAAVPALTQALEDQAPHVRSGAAWALGRIGPDAKSAVPKLLERIEDNGSADTGKPFVNNVGEMACAALWAIDPQAATQAGVPQIDFPWNRFGMDKR
jgi:HEAT repeat protein